MGLEVGILGVSFLFCFYLDILTYPLPFFVLQAIDPGQQLTWEHSKLEINKHKNRYANVIAYDHSRVILTLVDGKQQDFRL